MAPDFTTTHDSFTTNDHQTIDREGEGRQLAWPQSTTEASPDQAIDQNRQERAGHTSEHGRFRLPPTNVEG